MKCENCEKECDGSYGSGRFCSSKCARGFSTKAKRKKINQKVSKSLKGVLRPERRKLLVEVKCKICDKIMICKQGSEKTYCSKFCIVNDPEYIENLSKKRIEAIKCGKTNYNSIKCTYSFNGDNIQCDSKIEYVCLDYFEKNYEVLCIRRCDFAIKYKDNDRVRRFLPDFVIEIENKKFLIECKGCVASKILDERWRFYNRTSKLKKIALWEYCRDNNLEPFWFTKDMNIKLYNELRL